MAILLLKVEGVTIMLSSSQEPQERRICISLNLERKVGVAILAPLSLYCMYTIDKVHRIHIPQSEGDGNPPPQSGRGDHYAFPAKEEDGPPPMQRRICLSFNLKRKVEIYYEHKLYI